MAVLLLANIGNSDLWFDGKKLEDQRKDAETILADFETMRPGLTIPILAPMTDTIFANHRQAIDHVLLFSTDQPVSAGERFHRNDTIFSARAIARLLENDERFRGKVKSVACAPPITSAPNDLDNMMAWFADNLNRIVPAREYSEIYVSVTGGTPAANQALFFHCLYSLKNSGRRQLIYVSESGGVKLPRMVQSLDQEFQLGRIRSFLEQYNYSAVLEILRARCFGVQRILDLVASCDLRLNFRLDEARELVGKWRPQIHGEESRYYIRLDEQLKKLRKGIDDLVRFYAHQNLTEAIKAVFIELYQNLRVLFEGGRYVDMMARLFRLQEGLLRLHCERKLGISTSEIKRFEAEAEQVMDAALKRYLQQQQIHLKSTRKFHKAVVDYYATEFADFKKWNDKVNPLVEERNRMIIGHEFEGASQAFIASKYNGNLLEETAAMLRRVLKLDELPNDLPEINEFVFKQIRRHFE